MSHGGDVEAERDGQYITLTVTHPKKLADTAAEAAELIAAQEPEVTGAQEPQVADRPKRKRRVEYAKRDTERASNSANNTELHIVSYEGEGRDDWGNSSPIFKLSNNQYVTRVDLLPGLYEKWRRIPSSSAWPSLGQTAASAGATRLRTPTVPATRHTRAIAAAIRVGQVSRRPINSSYC
jgi:hypothetical protein